MAAPVVEKASSGLAGAVAVLVRVGTSVGVAGTVPGPWAWLKGYYGFLTTKLRHCKLRDRHNAKVFAKLIHDAVLLKIFSYLVLSDVSEDLGI